MNMSGNLTRGIEQHKKINIHKRFWGRAFGPALPPGTPVSYIGVPGLSLGCAASNLASCLTAWEVNR